MYVPSAFEESDPAILQAFLKRHGFATLVSAGEHGPVASHLPLLLDPDVGPQGTLLGHMARANPHWRDVRGESLAVFQGPHAYVSPSWYETEGTVPTWNYTVVHIYGSFQIIEDDRELLDVLKRSVAAYENHREKPWVFDENGPNVKSLLRSIVGFRIAISRVEGKFKLSQNHPEARRERVIRGLSNEDGSEARAVAELMAARERPGD